MDPTAKRFDEKVGDFYYHHPMIATVVTTSHGGRANALAVAWHCPLSKSPPLYGVSISAKRASHDAILDAGEFVVNFVPFEAARTVAQVGGTSGRELDKFQTFAIAKIPAAKLAAPVLECAYAAYECKLRSHHTFGDHEWFVGEVVGVHLDERAFGQDGVMDLHGFHPTLYLGADRYVTVDPTTATQIERGE